MGASGGFNLIQGGQFRIEFRFSDIGGDEKRGTKDLNILTKLVKERPLEETGSDLVEFEKAIREAMGGPPASGGRAPALSWERKKEDKSRAPGERRAADARGSVLGGTVTLEGPMSPATAKFMAKRINQALNGMRRRKGQGAPAGPQGYSPNDVRTDFKAVVINNQGPGTPEDPGVSSNKADLTFMPVPENEWITYLPPAQP